MGEERLHASSREQSPRLHSELLLMAATGLDRTSLYLQLSNPVPIPVTTRFWNHIQRRVSGEPIQYITGKTAFYGYDFSVGKGVFIPRFDSEVIVERSIALLGENAGERIPITILDLCSGCGALGLTIAAEVPGSVVTLSENNPLAIDFARLNTNRMGLEQRVTFYEKDVLKPFPEDWDGKFDLIVANPPYIPLAEVEELALEVQGFEPGVALTDGGDGLSFYRVWAESVPMLLTKPGKFITEIGDGAAKDVKTILARSFTEIGVIQDISGKDRALLCRRVV